MLNEPLKLSLINSVNDDENPDCGNMAMYKLFYEYPMLDARNTLATDYFVMDLATAMKQPSLHHNRTVFHEYAPTRFEFNRKVSYWEAVLKFCNYFNLYSDIYNGHLITEKTNKEEISSIIYNLSLRDTEKREKKLRKVLDEILYPFDENYMKVAKELYDVIPKIIDELNKEYKLHSKMILDWSKVIENTKRLDYSKY